MATVTTTNLSKLVLVYYDKLMLETLQEQVHVFHEFGEKKSLPKGEGNTVAWHRWNSFTKGRVLMESAQGVARGISATRVSATLYMIGDHAIITTYIDMVAINSVVEGAVKMFGYSSNTTREYCITRLLLQKRTSLSSQFEMSANNAYVGQTNLLSGTWAPHVSNTTWEAPMWCIEDLTSRVYHLSVTNGGVSSTLLTPNIFRNLRLKLRVKNARTFPDGYYKCILHPDLLNQLRGSSAFIDLNKYTQPGATGFVEGKMQRAGEKGLAGIMEGFKVYETTDAPMCETTGGTKQSAHGYGRYYFSFFFGEGAYGVTDFDGGIQTYIKTPGPSSTNDPLNQWSTVGYKMIFTARVLNPSACLWLLSGKPTAVG